MENSIDTLRFKATEIGKFDKARRYHICSAFTTESSRAIRSPSRSYPYSEYKHIFTKKYAKQLAEKYNVVQVIITN